MILHTIYKYTHFTLFPPGFGGKAPCRGGRPHGDVTVVFVHVFSPCVFVEECGYVLDIEGLLLS